MATLDELALAAGPTSSTEGTLLNEDATSGTSDKLLGDDVLSALNGGNQSDQTITLDGDGWQRVVSTVLSTKVNLQRYNGEIYWQIESVEKGGIIFVILSTGSVIKITKGETIYDSTYEIREGSEMRAEPGSLGDMARGGRSVVYNAAGPLDRIHFVLDMAGLIPGIGESADMTNGILYLAEGDVSNASLSALALWPWGGQVATASRYGDELIYFGKQGDLAKRLVLHEAGDNAHHIIPWELRNHDVVQLAARDGFDMNDPMNGLRLMSFDLTQVHLQEEIRHIFNLTDDEVMKLNIVGIHANHPAYNKYVEKRFDEFASRYTSIEEIAPDEARRFISDELIPELETAVLESRANNAAINDYFIEALQINHWY